MLPGRSVRYKISVPAIQFLESLKKWPVFASNSPDWICAIVAPAESVQVLGSNSDFEPAGAIGADWRLCSPGDSRGPDNSFDDVGFDNLV